MKLSLKLFLTVRLSAAVWSTVADCDETFNYWEPMHFLLYGKGFQVRYPVLYVEVQSPRHLLIPILFPDMGVLAKVRSPVVPLHPFAPAPRVVVRPNCVSPSNVSLLSHVEIYAASEFDGSVFYCISKAGTEPQNVSVVRQKVSFKVKIPRNWFS